MANVLLGIHCVVPGCGNTQRRVNQWKAQPCSKPRHKGKSHSQCGCPEPYQFFKFPPEVKLQKLWLERVKRPDSEVNNLTRVCSLHFIEGKPTRRNYFPNIINVKKNSISPQEDEADNEEEIEEQYYDDEMPPPKRRGGVSIVPMERLQEQGEEDVGGMEQEDEGYDGNLTISRYQFHGGEAYEVPTNSVTITRVTSTSAVATAPPSGPPTKPSNRFINKSRVAETSSGNRFLRERGTASSSSGMVPRNPQTSTTSKRPSTNSGASNILIRNGGGGGRNAAATKIENVSQEDEGCPFEIDMLVDENDEDDDNNDDDGDSSELSDIGIDIQPTITAGTRKHRFTSKDLSTAKTLSSLGVSRHAAPPPTTHSVTQKEAVQIAKPKMIPVLAVAPKTQLQQSAIFQPVIGRTNNLVQQQTNNRKYVQNQQVASTSNVLIASSSTGSKPIITSTTSLATGAPEANGCRPIIANNSVIAVTGCVMPKTDMTSVAVATPTSSSTTSTATTSNSAAASPATPTLATYDPTKQQLQIANPVKYIQECHARIAQLLAEKQSLESKNTDLEGKVQELQKSNNDLRREIVHQALNAARRAPPHQLNAAPTFNLVPTAILDNSSADDISNGSGTSDNGNASNKPRIRYLIRRPTNGPSENT